MFDWFIDLAYFIKDCEIFYIIFVYIVGFALYLLVSEYVKKLELEEKVENYEKVQEFMEYLFRNKQDLRKEVSDYLRRKMMIKNREERQKEIDDFMSIL